jgi:hypothetical protein
MQNNLRGIPVHLPFDIFCTKPGMGCPKKTESLWIIIQILLAELMGTVLEPLPARSTMSISDALFFLL